MAKKPKYPEQPWFKRPVSANKPIPVSQDNHKEIVVNGQTKRISKLSEYHLDMLTLDANDKNKNNKD